MDLMIVDVVCRDNKPHAWPKKLVGDDANEFLADFEAPDAPRVQTSVVTVFGRLENGRSIAVFVEGYQPWVRLRCPNCYVDPGALGRTLANRWRLSAPLPTVLERMPMFYGFEPDGATGQAKQYQFAKVQCPTFEMARRLANACASGARLMDVATTDNMFYTVDAGLLPAAKFINDLGLAPSGWMRLNGVVRRESGHKYTTCDEEVFCSSGIVQPLPDKTQIAPLRVLSLDGEMFSHDGLFPSVVKGDFTVAVCTTLWTYGQPVAAAKRTAFLVRPKGLEEPPAAGAVMCDNNCDLFEKLRDLIVTQDPDIVTGWNIFGFDMPFMYDEYVAAYLQPWCRGSEAMAMAVAKASGKPREPLGALVRRLVSSKKYAEWGGAEALAGRHKSLMYKSAELPEHIAAPLRATARRTLRMPPEAPLAAADVAAHAAVHQGLAAVVGPPRRAGLRSSDDQRPGRGLYMSRFLCEPVGLAEKRMASQARGDNTYYWWNATGRTMVDLMQVIKDDKKLEDNTLKFAAQTFLDPEFGKLDMTPQEMFRAFRDADAHGLSDMIEYCARDADIPVMLMSKLSYVPIWVEMSRVCFTPLGAVVNGGQQRKVYNLIARFVSGDHGPQYALNARPSGWPVSPLADGDDADDPTANEDALKKRKPDYQGATVIEPKAGFYQDPISTLDFESLYPSIMIHFNLCPSVLDIDQKAAADGPFVTESHTIHHTILVSAGASDAVVRRDLGLTTETVIKRLTGHEAEVSGAPPGGEYVEFDKTYRFVKNVAGVLPRLLQHLLKARKAAKRAMAAAPDEFERAVQNGRQLALKVSCNSVYGFCGTNPRTGMLSCKPVAAVVTLNGREFIEAAKVYAETAYPGSVVVYGDSVTPDTAVVVRQNGAALVRRIDELVSDWRPWHEDKEAVAPEALEVWTDSGWAAVKRVIRHRLSVDKRLLRVLTHTGLVDCTDDHSLVLADGTRVSPAHVGIGARLLHANAADAFSVAAAPVGPAEAWVWGLFMADGSADVYDCPSGRKATWAINKADMQLLREAQAKMASVGYTTTINDTLASSGVYKLVLTSRSYGDATAKRYRDLFYNSAREKIVPDYILGAPLDIAQAFWDGFYAGDGQKAHGRQVATRFTHKGKQSCAGLLILAQRLGYKFSINDRSDKPTCFNMNFTRGSQRKPVDIVKRIADSPMERPEYVYDLETFNGHFGVGPGNLVVHNTDSIMINWRERDAAGVPRPVSVPRAYQLAEDASAAITLQLRHGHGHSAPVLDLAKSAVTLANEKVYQPYLLIQKKNYAGRKYTLKASAKAATALEDFDVCIDMKGIDAVRRDRSKLVKAMSEAILDALLVNNSIDLAIASLTQTVNDVVDNKTPLDQFVLSKSLKGQYASDNQPHVRAWQRMQARGDQDIPEVGTRMPYVIVAGRSGTSAHEDAALSERTEHPAYVFATGLRPCPVYYLQNAKDVVERLLGPTGLGPRVRQLFEDAIDKAKHKQTRSMSLLSFKKLKTS